MQVSTQLPRPMRARRSRPPLRAFAVGLLLLPMLMGAGCRSTAPEDPETRYGHRYEATAPDGRTVLMPEPVADTSGFFLNPIYVDSLGVRIGEDGSDEGHRVDALVDGTLADACTELHSVEQERHGQIVEVTLLARRPKGAMCAQMVQPFRTYVELDGIFAPGAYTLKVNDTAHPFEVE